MVTLRGSLYKVRRDSPQWRWQSVRSAAWASGVLCLPSDFYSGCRIFALEEEEAGEKDRDPNRPIFKLCLHRKIRMKIKKKIILQPSSAQTKDMGQGRERRQGSLVFFMALPGELSSTTYSPCCSPVRQGTWLLPSQLKLSWTSEASGKGKRNKFLNFLILRP